MPTDLIPGEAVPDAPPWPTGDVHCSACHRCLFTSDTAIGWNENGQAVVVCGDDCAARWRAAHPQ